jgi:hypothetical protein
MGRRLAEVWTAAAMAAAGAVVSIESLTHDIGWNATGPGPGYFPFRVGLLLIAAAAIVLFQQLRSADSQPFVSGDQLRRTWSVFWPTLALAAGMLALGCYVPSAGYLAWMMRRHGSYGWGRSLLSGVGAMTVFFLVFDVWFRVPLAKGPIESALGIF